MSKNNLEVNSDVKVTQTVEGPKTVTPNVFKLRPLRIEQPIEIVQSVNLTGPEQPAEPTPAPAPAPVAAPAETPAPKAKKAKCKVRKAQKVWLVIALLIAAAVALGYAFYLPFYNFVGTLRDSNAANDYAAWTPLNHALTFAIVLGAAFIATVLVRFICHPFACKAKKGRHCCFRCETLKFFWTILVLGLGIAALFAYLKLFSLDKAVAGALAFNNIYALVFLGAAALVFVVLVIASIANRKHKRQAKLAAKEETLAAANTTGAYEDIDSPYNAYRNNKKATKKRGSKFGKFIKFVLVLVVLVVAYAAVAYFVPQVPGHDFVAGLIAR